MYPTKSAYDYMTEINRLFPRTNENDVFRSPNTMPNPSVYSPFGQSRPANRSLSSTDSTSPDSFPDMSHRSDTDRQSFETSFISRHQCPIDKPERAPPTLEPTYSIWQPDTENFFPPTPPSIRVEQKNYTQNMFYELFPTENRGFEFKLPVATLSPASSHTPVSPTMPTTTNSVGPRSSKHQETKSSKMCTFCRKNGETPLVYMTHDVREKVGNKNIVTCPRLRSHVCSTCGASGDNAHITFTSCPVLRSSNRPLLPPHTTTTRKNTRNKSNGNREM